MPSSLVLLVWLATALAGPPNVDVPAVPGEPDPIAADAPEKAPLFSDMPDKMSGVRFGAATASFYGRDMGDSAFRPGYAFGWWRTLKLFWQWSFQYEFTYVQKGAKLADFGPEYTHLDDTRVYANYIEMPWLIRTKVPMPKKIPIKPYTITGVYSAIRLSGKSGEDKERIQSWSLLDVGYYAGGGTEIYLKEKYAFSLDTRVSIGKMSVDFGNHMRTTTVVMTTGASF